MGKGGGGHFSGTRGSRNSIPSERSIAKHIFRNKKDIYLILLKIENY